MHLAPSHESIRLACLPCSSRMQEVRDAQREVEFMDVMIKGKEVVPLVAVYVCLSCDDIDESKGLEVKVSSIPQAGLGLFAKNRFFRGEVICVYTGSHLRTREAIRMPDKSYLMRLGPQIYVDALDHPEVFARYINDCRNASLYNVKFEKLPLEGKAHVVALKDIEPGQEFFVDYGRWYWLCLRPGSLDDDGLPVDSTQPKGMRQLR